LALNGLPGEDPSAKGLQSIHPISSAQCSERVPGWRLIFTPERLCE
jgi:hypothetical protein